MSTHNICFCREIRKILCGYPLLSVAMTQVNIEKFQCPVIRNGYYDLICVLQFTHHN